MYEGDILAEFSDEIEYVSDLGMDNENWSIHMSYLSMIEATVIPLYVPISWLNEYHEKLEQLIVKATNQGILIIGMDEFYVEKKQDYYHMIPKQSADHRFCSLMSSMAIVRDQNLSFLTFQEVDNKKKYATIAGLLL